jgi:hypothetical protein
MMTPWDRHQCFIHGEIPDRVHVLAATDLLIGSQGGWARRLMQRGLCIIHIVVPYRPNISFPFQVNPYIKEVRYSYTSFYENGIWKTRHVLETPVGMVDSIVCRNPNISIATEATESHFIKHPKDWLVVNYLFRTMVDSMRPNYEELERDQDELGKNGYTIAVVERTPFQRSWIELASLERTIFDIKDKQEGFLEYLEIQTELHKRAAEITAGCPSDHVLIVDNITNTISPNYYREYCLPYYQIYKNAFKGTNKVLAVHHDGRFGHLKDEIADASFDIIDSFTIPPSGDVSLTEAKVLWPSKIISVNIPPHLIWLDGNQLRESYAQILEEWGSNRLAIEHVEDIPLEKVENHLSTILEVCGY